MGQRLLLEEEVRVALWDERRCGLWDGRRSGWSAEDGEAGADTAETGGDGGGSWAGTREC